MKKVKVFDYSNYRTYLKDVYAAEKVEKKHFSLRYFARITGFGSNGYLLMVMNGQRNLSAKSIALFNKAFKHTKKEAAYFEALVFYNQTDQGEQKERYLEQLIALRPAHAIGSMTKEQFECLTQTYFLSIRELAALPDFNEDPEWISENLRQKIKPSEAKHALQVLEKLKLLVRDEHGKLKHSDAMLETPLHAESLEILNYHRQTLTETKYAMLTAPYDEWDIASITIPMPKEAIPKVMEIMQKCREEIADYINKTHKDYHEVFQINMQLYPVSKTKRPKTTRVKTS